MARPPTEALRHRQRPGTSEGRSHRQVKEVFEMAASLFIEEESGIYTARIRHPHNGYYAGDFAPTSRSGSELHLSYVQRRDLLRAWQ